MCKDYSHINQPMIKNLRQVKDLLGTTDVTWKPMLTTIPDVRLAAQRAKVACIQSHAKSHWFEIEGIKKDTLSLWD